MSQERPDTEKKVEEDSSLSSEQHLADKGLMAFLDEIHASMPDVPEEDAQKDIEEVIAAIRNQSKC